MSYRFLKDNDGNLFVSPLLNVEDVAAGVRAEGYNEGYGKGYDDGHDVGVDEAENACSSKHFVTTVKPNKITDEKTGELVDPTSITFECPFAPDFLTVYGFGNRVEDGVGFCTMDINGGAYYGGAGAVFIKEVNSEGDAVVGLVNVANVSNTLSSRYIRDETKGTITIKNIMVVLGKGTRTGKFLAGNIYTVVAVKIDEETT